MTRPLGALRDPPGRERGEPLHRLAAVRDDRTLHDSVDLRAHVTRIPDQRGQSCGGHALAQCLRVRASMQGVHLDPSAMAIYAVARELETPGVASLPDVGSYAFRLLEGLNDWGVVARGRWQDDADPSSPVSIDVLEAGALAYVTGEYAIGAERRVEIMQALTAGYPVFWARDVDAAYMRWDDWLYTGLRGDVLGGHAGCIVGYDSYGIFDAGSWGRGHGANGFTHITWPFVESDHAYSFHVVTVTPLEVT